MDYQCNHILTKVIIKVDVFLVDDNNRPKMSHFGTWIF